MQNKVWLIKNCLENIANLTGEILYECKGTKKNPIPQKTRDKLISLNHSAIMALNHLASLNEK